MNELQTQATQPTHSQIVGKSLQPTRPDFAEAKAATYAQFEAARRKASTVVEASPLVRWANQELRKRA